MNFIDVYAYSDTFLFNQFILGVILTCLYSFGWFLKASDEIALTTILSCSSKDDITHSFTSEAFPMSENFGSLECRRSPKYSLGDPPSKRSTEGKV